MADPVIPNVPGYRIERKLGQGAMASVYLATHLALERQVALKIMAASLGESEESRKRFHIEGKIIAKIDHPNVVRIYDIGVVDGSFFMAMEYIEGGRTLKEEITDSPGGLSSKRAAEIIRTTASALAYAHKLGYVHRDIKPTNILLRANGSPVLTDFGIAKIMDSVSEATLTRKGWILGTPSYMSPEQVRGEKVDSRCDVYSLGVMFYELLTGEKPYRANDAFAVAAMHVNAPLPLLPKPLVAFQPVINRMMAKSADERYASIEQVIADIDAIIAPSTSATQASPLSRRVVAVAIAALVLLLSVTLYLMVFRQPEPLPQIELTAEQQESLSQLLDLASLYRDAGRLVDPPISNAVYALYEALAIDPYNEQALAMLDEIASHYHQEAEQALASGADRQRVEQLIQFGLQARKDRKDLQELLEEARTR